MATESRDEHRHFGRCLDAGELIALVRAGESVAGTRLAELDLAGANLRGADLRGASISGTNFEGANLEGAQLNNATLRNVRGMRANLSHASFEQATITNSDFSDARMFGGDLSDSVWQAQPVFEGAPEEMIDEAILQRLADDPNSVRPEEIVLKVRTEEFSPRQCVLRGVDLTGARLDRATFDDINLHESRFFGGSATKTSFKNCAMTKWSARESSFEEASFEDCDL
ncbi:MAG: pentapeptide repeat-containing protein, partial [Planctomycetota bacterium]